MQSIHYHSRALHHIRGNLNVDTAITIACTIGSSRQRDCARRISGANMNKLQSAQITLILRRLH